MTFTMTSAVAPSITSLSPASGAVGTAVTISGSNFGSTRGTSTVTFNGIAATPTNWSATSIVAPVPAGARQRNVVVTVGGLSSAKAFTVTGTAPAVTSLTPASGPSHLDHDRRREFRIDEGHEHGDVQRHDGNADVLVGDGYRLPVPAGATTGNVVVTVNSVASNGPFTVGTPSTIAFVQTNYATPQSPTASVSVPFTAAQTAGNLNVVVIGWNDSTRTLQSVTDSKGNVYRALLVQPCLRAS